MKDGYEIFDSHMHYLGKFMEKGQSIIDYMDVNGIDTAVVNTINTLVNSRNIGANKFTNKIDIKNFAEEIRGPNFEIFKEFRLNGQPSHDILLEQVKKHPKRLFPFFWYNPADPSDLDQKIGLKMLIDKLQHEGFRGVKLQLAMTPCNIERIFPVAKVCVDFDLPICIHPSPGVFSVKRTDAFALLKLAKSFPTLKLIILHAVYTMEFYVELLIALKTEKIENVYFETSCSILYGILELIKIFGADRVLFGSDSPTATPFELEYNKIASLRIPEEDKRKILGGNIKKLLNIEI